jgi:hypothetical protein
MTGKVDSFSHFVGDQLFYLSGHSNRIINKWQLVLWQIFCYCNCF